MAPHSKKRHVAVAMWVLFVLVVVVLLALYAIPMGLFSQGAGPTYSVAQMVTGLRTNPRQWGGRTVTVRGVAVRPSREGFMLFDQYPPPGNRPAHALWVTSSSGNWRFEVMLWDDMVTRYMPNSSTGLLGVYRIKLPLALCAQGEQCPGELAR